MLLIAIVLAAVGLSIVLLGAKGFSEDGIPLTYDRSLCGGTGRCVGIVCLLVGSPMVVFAVLLMVVSAGQR
ncbi:MAG: hypothetical protein M3478_00305 [Planctomycetota bacterium]|nr:hypothetical protein [Planctomycetota bacterium]